MERKFAGPRAFTMRQVPFAVSFPAVASRFGTVTKRTKTPTRVVARHGAHPRCGAMNVSRGAETSCSTSWIKQRSIRSRRIRLERPSTVRVRADASSGKWVESEKKEDPLAGALHQSRGLRQRLADITGGSGLHSNEKRDACTENNETRPDDDWDHWLSVIDKADAEGEILTALEVRFFSILAAFTNSQRRRDNDAILTLDTILSIPINPINRSNF